MEKIKDVRIGIIVSASKSLDYMNINKYATIEEVMEHVLKSVFSDDEMVNCAIIASANFTYNYKMRNFLFKNKEILKEVTKSTNNIISQIESVRAN
jgi:vacuolar-type H+-ATPase subunit E/Vma4